MWWFCDFHNLRPLLLSTPAKGTQPSPQPARSHAPQKDAMEEIIVSDSVADPDLVKMVEKMQQKGVKLSISYSPVVAASANSFLLEGGLKVDPERPEESNREIIKRLLPHGMQRKMSLWNVGKEYREINGGEPELISYRFHFIRVEKRRIMRDERSYFDVEVLPDGQVKRMELRWPLISYRKIIGRKPVELDFAMNALQEELDSNFTEFQNRNLQRTMNARAHHVKGVAKAWCKDVSENGLDLIPCLSFQIQAKLSDRDSVAGVVDQPMITKE